MAELTEDQRRELETLRQAYEAELPEKVTSIARAAAFVGLRRWDAADVLELHRLVHRLAGSAAIWGFTAVSKAAGELEEIVMAAMGDSPPGMEVLQSAVPRLVDELQHAVPPTPRASH
jgi:HPt (histidine-containing phosphotransfer) domain-containing protein